MRNHLWPTVYSMEVTLCKGVAIPKNVIKVYAVKVDNQVELLCRHVNFMPGNVAEEF